MILLRYIGIDEPITSTRLIQNETKWKYFRFIYERMEFVWHARTRFDVVIGIAQRNETFETITKLVSKELNYYYWSSTTYQVCNWLYLCRFALRSIPISLSSGNLIHWHKCGSMIFFFPFFFISSSYLSVFYSM